MKNPYDVLEVAATADDARIKKAYLGMVRRYPPERCPEDFQRIQQAYERIKTEEDRLSYRLFHCVVPEPADIAALLLAPVAKKERPGREAFQQQLRLNLQRFCATTRI